MQIAGETTKSVTTPRQSSSRVSLQAAYSTKLRVGGRERGLPCPAGVRIRRRGGFRLAVPVSIDVVDVRAVLPVEREGDSFGAAPEVRLQALPRLPEVEALHVLVSLLAGAPEVLDVLAALHLPELAEVRLGLHRRGDFRLVLRDPVERVDVVLPVVGEEPVDPFDGVRVN